jgi:Zn2+/Cd2+-exporting ATPase
VETYRLRNLDCADCARKIQDGLRGLPGVRAASVDFATLSLRIDADDISAVARRIRSLEPAVRLEPDGGSAEAGPMEEKPFSAARELAVLGTGLVLCAAGWLLPRAFSGQAWPGTGWVQYILFAAAYLLAGWKVVYSAARNIIKGRVFDENFLMTVATAGAFAIGAFAEAAAVMIFYKMGEILQGISVARSRRSIRRILDLRPTLARVQEDGAFRDVRPEDVRVGQVVNVRPGEKVPLDGRVELGSGFMDTSAMTGESVPRRVGPGSEVLAGYISSDGSLLVRVTRKAGESGAARIIQMVEQATHAKAKTELFITRFARVYTPLVVAGAALVAFLPPLIFAGAAFHDWIYRALTMLVISCPCALVVSIPLGYFGGIGGASRHGILVKGARYLDALADVKTVVFDKTGTLTKGVFKVTSVAPAEGGSAQGLLKYAAMAEAHSNHPIAASIRESFGDGGSGSHAESYQEIGGRGVSAVVDGHDVIAGNHQLLHDRGIAHAEVEDAGTSVHVAVDGVYAGRIDVGDEVKEDARESIRGLRGLGVRRTVLLTGDSSEAAHRTAMTLGMGEHHGDLLPADKVALLERIMADQKGRARTAFVGDGINDAPVLARSDVGVAMGRSGADAAVESADVVLMSDDPARMVDAIRRARRTRRIVVQNIILALGVKGVFLALGAAGVATMWEAVIADMGVALAAILNAARALR